MQFQALKAITLSTRVCTEDTLVVLISYSNMVRMSLNLEILDVDYKVINHRGHTPLEATITTDKVKTINYILERKLEGKPLPEDIDIIF